MVWVSWKVLTCRGVAAWTAGAVLVVAGSLAPSLADESGIGEAGMGEAGMAETAVPDYDAAAADDALAEEIEEDDDFFGPFNRLMFGINEVVRTVVLDPLADGYQAVMPDPLQEGISNMASNITEPLTIGSSLLQGDFDNAGTATERFLINSTAGLAGFNDTAAEMGLEQRREDLGQAAGVHGIPPGPHIVLPLFGPSNLRDAGGNILTSLVNPLPLIGSAASGFVTYADNQETIHAISAMSLDPYIAEREAYEQNRQFEVMNGNVMPPSFADDDPFADYSSIEDPDAAQE